MGEAREFVRDVLGEALPAARIGDAELMTSELVSNAVQHGSSNADTIGLEIDVRSEAVRVSVADAGAGFAFVERGPDREIGGWGLYIVDQLADRWGTQDDPHRVWFELDR